MTIITNMHNLPRPLVEGIRKQNSRKGKRGRALVYSVTEIVRPPLISALARIHSDSVIEDASAYLWRIYGTSVHGTIEDMVKESGENLPELRLSAELGEYTIRGIVDMIELDSPEGVVVWDWKTTSMWAAKRALEEGMPDDWRAQLNVYAWLAMKNGQKVDKLRIGMILRDYSLNRAREIDVLVPGLPFARISCDPWPIEKTEEYIRQRIRAINENLLAIYERRPVPHACTPDERYVRDETWAVKKKGTKRAVRNGLRTSREDAEAFIEKLLKLHGPRYRYEIEYREGLHQRCAEYCDFALWCPAIRKKERQMVIERRVMLESQAKVPHRPAPWSGWSLPSYKRLLPGDTTIIKGESERVCAYRFWREGEGITPDIIVIGVAPDGDRMHRVFMPWDARDSAFFTDETGLED